MIRKIVIGFSQDHLEINLIAHPKMLVHSIKTKSHSIKTIHHLTIIENNRNSLYLIRTTKIREIFIRDIKS